MADTASQDRDRLAGPTLQGPPGLLASYQGRYVPKTPDAGVSRFAYRVPYSPTAYGPGSNYTAYNQQDK